MFHKINIYSIHNLFPIANVFSIGSACWIGCFPDGILYGIIQLLSSTDQLCTNKKLAYFNLEIKWNSLACGVQIEHFLYCIY